VGTYSVSLSIVDVNGCTSAITLPNLITTFAIPTAAFTQSVSQSCDDPLNVSFTNNSTGSGLTYNWLFGNGNASTLLTPPVQVYSSIGTYPNTLIVTNSIGCSDTTTQNVSIETFVANFGQDTTTGCPGQVISFTDSTTNTVTNWNWDFGDGNFSSLQNPAHPYASAGTYTVKLIASNAFGCIDSLIKTTLITINPTPTPSFSSNDSSACQIPFVVNFTDLSTSATSWNWTFGDGNTDTLQNPTNIYTSSGSFNVTLTIVDNKGCSGATTNNSYINIVPPAVNFSIDTSSGCVPLTVNFTDLSFSNETITNWYWDFGNGDTSTAQNPTVNYVDTGLFNVTLVIVNVDGCTDTLIMNDFVRVGQPPLLNFSPLSTAGCFPLSLNFYDSSSVYSDEWFWDFGDNGTDITQNPIHTYADTGYFNITFAAGFHGCWDTLSIDSVVEVLLPIALFNATPLTACYAPDTVTFVDNSTGPDTWIWRFGDGSEDTLQNPLPHIYTTPGIYTVTLVVGNNITGCMDSTTQTVTISDRIPGFDQTDTIGCRPFNVTFTDTSIVNTSITNWYWDFGDGGLDSVQNPNYTYNTAGVFDVRLIITDAIGCNDTLVKTNWIDTKGLPTAQFGADTTYGCTPLAVNFTDSSTGINPILNWD